MFSQFGPLELVLVLVILLVIFGPKRLPSLGRNLGKGMREFKASITGADEQREPADEAGEPPALAPAQPQEAADSAAPEQQPAEAAPERRG